jgi:hypothetical protein
MSPSISTAWRRPSASSPNEAWAEIVPVPGPLQTSCAARSVAVQVPAVLARLTSLISWRAPWPTSAMKIWPVARSKLLRQGVGHPPAQISSSRGAPTKGLSAGIAYTSSHGL